MTIPIILKQIESRKTGDARQTSHERFHGLGPRSSSPVSRSISAAAQCRIEQNSRTLMEVGSPVSLESIAKKQLLAVHVTSILMNMDAPRDNEPEVSHVHLAGFYFFEIVTSVQN